MILTGAGGIALSPAIVVGYLMYKNSWNFETAMSHVQARRYCVNILSVSMKCQFKVALTRWPVPTTAERV
jgi:hypothetical protein